MSDALKLNLDSEISPLKSMDERLELAPWGIPDLLLSLFETLTLYVPLISCDSTSISTTILSMLLHPWSWIFDLE